MADGSGDRNGGADGNDTPVQAAASSDDMLEEAREQLDREQSDAAQNRSMSPDDGLVEAGVGLAGAEGTSGVEIEGDPGRAGLAEPPSLEPSPTLEPRRGEPSIHLSVQPTERLSRALLFVKWLLVIPAYFVVGLYGIAVWVTTFIAFWAILFTGQYPKGLFDLARSYMALNARTVAYFPLLLTDQYPLSGSWEGSADGAIRYDVDYPESLSRPRLLLKLVSFLLFIVFFLIYLPILLLSLAAAGAWFAILFTGRYPRRLFRFVASLYQWVARVLGWQYLMRDEWSLFGTTRVVAIPVGIGALLSAGLGVSLLVSSWGLSTTEMTVGDCFDIERERSSRQVTRITFAECGSLHDGEVYEVAALSEPPGAPFPSNESLFTAAFDRCLPKFADFVGKSYEESVFDIFVHVPNSKTWTALDDRSVLCSVFRIDSEPFRGSARGSGL